MDASWQRTFQDRMRRFEMRRPPRSGEVAVSIKIRVKSGCFHREHSPRAYELIDRRLAKLSSSETVFVFEEHESGPELFSYVTLLTRLAKSVIDLITAIIKARAEGIKKGDHPSDPVELIVRRIDDKRGVREEIVLRIGPDDVVDRSLIAERLTEALLKIASRNK